MKEKINKFFLEIYEKLKTYILEEIEKIKILLKPTVDDFTIIDIEDNCVRWTFNWWYTKFLRWFIATIIACLTLFLWGCGGAVITKYHPVSVPIVCNVDIPEKPKYDKDVVITNINILAYAEKLKSALKVCSNGGLND